MARYNTRDLIGHFVKPRSAEGKMCPHACCRNKRVHPDNMPVILPSRLLRRASDDDLAEHYRDLGQRDSADAEAGQYQVLAEMERRDTAEATRRQHAEAAESARGARRMEHAADRERIYLDAEAYTRGNWVNRAGREAGISDREILAGREATFRRYASEEAREYFSEHPRPTAAYFRGQDTRYVARYSSPYRRRSAGLPPRPARRAGRQLTARH